MARRGLKLEVTVTGQGEDAVGLTSILDRGQFYSMIFDRVQEKNRTSSIIQVTKLFVIVTEVLYTQLKTSCRSNLAKSRIAAAHPPLQSFGFTSTLHVLSPLVAANSLVRRVR